VGKAALVTGGASGIVADRDRGRATSLVETIVRSGGSAEFEPVDVAIPEPVESLFERVASRHAVLDVLVPNAGIMICKTLEQTEVAEAELHLSGLDRYSHERPVFWR
jgi:NAD(P)-dependent dehydrogenase (short-subunit alcohol dehydrogenase family)